LASASAVVTGMRESLKDLCRWSVGSGFSWGTLLARSSRGDCTQPSSPHNRLRYGEAWLSLQSTFVLSSSRSVTVSCVWFFATDISCGRATLFVPTVSLFGNCRWWWRPERRRLMGIRGGIRRVDFRDARLKSIGCSSPELGTILITPSDAAAID
jgi:hypothetical protein